MEKATPPPQHQGPKSKEHLSHQPARAKPAPRHIPRLRAVVESQAFKNILVDEMDMMHSRAATLIQASWRGYQLRQKLISQMTAAKAIQEAWRRFSSRHILHSSKLSVKKATAEEGDIPYHAPQQVRFQHLEENHLLCPPVRVNKETQFPSCDNLVLCRPQSTPLLQTPTAQGAPDPCMQTPPAAGVPGLAFLPHQTVTIRFPCPVNPDTKCQPCLLTRTIRSACLVHIEGDSVKAKRVTARTNKARAPETPLSGRCGRAVMGPSTAQTQCPVEAETLKAHFQVSPGPTIAKTLLHTYPVVSMTLPQMCPASMVTKIPPKTSPVPTVTTTKTPASTSLRPAVTKTAPHACPMPTVTKLQAHPAASGTGTPLQTRPATITAKNAAQACLLASIMKSPPQICPGPSTAKTPPQTCQAAAPAKNLLQTCPAATTSKTSSQTSPGGVTKPSPQTRLAAIITRTPAQLRSVATILRTLCLSSPAAGSVKAPPPAAVPAGIPNTPCSTHENQPKAKAEVNGKLAVEVVKASSRSCVAEGKIRCLPQPHLGAGVPRAPAKLPLEAEKIETGPQRQVKIDTAFKTSVAVGTSGAPSWTKAAEEGDDPPHLFLPIEEMAVTVPQGQLAAPLTNASSQRHPPCLSRRQQASPLTKASSQGHLPTELTKTPSLDHLVTCLSKVHSQTHLAAGAMKVQSQAHLSTCLAKTQSPGQQVTDVTKCLIPAHQAADLSSKTHSQVLLTRSKAPSQACQHLGALSAPPWAKPEDRRTQPQPHSQVPGTTTQRGPCPAASEVPGTLVPLMAPTGHSACNVESWGDSGAARAQPSVPGQVVPSQEDTGPVDAGVAGGQSWNCTVPSAVVRPVDRGVARGSAWESAGGVASWETRCHKAVVHPRRSRDLTVSIQATEESLILAVITIQAGARGYLVRRKIRVWHQRAVVIQAAWRGHCVRRSLAHLYRAITIIQAAWRGYCTRRNLARHRQRLHPVLWAKLGSRVRVPSDGSRFQDGRAKSMSDHRCFQACQPHVCSVCHSLSSRIGSPPSVVMLVGSSPRTCHTCGHTQPTRVVQGMGRVARGPGAASWASVSQRAVLSARQPHHQDKAATAIQSAWRGFKIRRQMRQQQMAAKMVQATWRGHYTRSCLKSPEALLGPAGPWASSRHAHRPCL
ncbi:IQ domain-containing protein N isoform X2 [Cebus imitator]|uniref:IQ domain-containing protein N isoform X2 n=1 Tax=Cebus imitator TaxID=2715852 RepID=UPI0018995ABD|nr:IQ domain-containing protein N isoform X2 [Cebus imitator]